MNRNARLGRVVTWDRDGGWGVIDSEATPGGCWVHFSHLPILGSVPSSLTVGEEVEFLFEALEAHNDQDGFLYRALAVHPLDGGLPR